MIHIKSKAAFVILTVKIIQEKGATFAVTPFLSG